VKRCRFSATLMQCGELMGPAMYTTSLTRNLLLAQSPFTPRLAGVMRTLDGVVWQLPVYHAVFIATLNRHP